MRMSRKGESNAGLDNQAECRVRRSALLTSNPPRPGEGPDALEAFAACEAGAAEDALLQTVGKQCQTIQESQSRNTAMNLDWMFGSA